MRDVVRVSVEANGEGKTVRVHGTEGKVEAGDATFRFSVTGSASGGADSGADGSDSPAGDDPRRIAPLGDVPADGTLRCEAIDGRRGTEFILGRDGDAVFAWRNSCPHEPDVRLDPGGGAIVAGDHVVCHEHGARFQRDDGVCTRGPCRGAVLDEIDVSVADGDVYLTDDRFEAGYRLDGRNDGAGGR